MCFTVRFLLLFSFTLFISSCQAPNLNNLAEKPIAFFQKIGSSSENVLEVSKKNPINQKSLSDVISAASPSIDVEAGFALSIQSAVANDPAIVIDKQALISRSANIRALESGKGFQVSGSVYGGFEDVSDETTGVAIVLSAKRLIFDGGKLDASIAAERLALRSSELLLASRENDKARELAELWVNLNQYEVLSSEIESRLSVLTPLIEQLERVAEAGIGDLTRVAAAQRTVSEIEATKADILERREQARLMFVNTFGKLPTDHTIDFGPISKAMPRVVTDETYEEAPALRSAYLNYQSKEAYLASVRATDNFSVGFESSVQRPFGGSARDSDEQVGLVVNKTLYNGKRSSSEIDAAESDVRGSMYLLQKTYKDKEAIIVGGQQKLASMDKAIDLAEKNISDMQDEIIYLKQQLVIGGSTLDSVLTAEARLYAATAKVVNFTAEKRKAILVVLSSLGLLNPLFNL